MPNVTTSIPLKWWNKAKELHIRWNEALLLGVKTMINEPFKEFEGEKIEKESDVSKVQKVQKTMQSHIDFLNNQLDKLKGKNLPLDDGKNAKLV